MRCAGEKRRLVLIERKLVQCAQEAAKIGSKELQCQEFKWLATLNALSGRALLQNSKEAMQWLDWRRFNSNSDQPSRVCLRVESRNSSHVVPGCDHDHQSQTHAPVCDRSCVLFASLDHFEEGRTEAEQTCDVERAALSGLHCDSLVSD